MPTPYLFVESDGHQPVVWITEGPDDPAPLPLLTRGEVVANRPPNPDSPWYATRKGQYDASVRLWDFIVAAVNAETTGRL